VRKWIKKKKKKSWVNKTDLLLTAKRKIGASEVEGGRDTPTELKSPPSNDIEGDGACRGDPALAEKGTRLWTKKEPRRGKGGPSGIKPRGSREGRYHLPERALKKKEMGEGGA